MDWAVQAARKKTQRVPGSSRSIIESLNLFNNALTEGDLEVNKVLNETQGWLRDVQATRNVQLSPEKTVKIGEKEQVQIEEKTPERATALPSATPKSLAEEPTKETEEPLGELEEPRRDTTEVRWDKFKDRSTRRSNMFIPLPSKDPLVVQPAAAPAVPQLPPASVQSSTALSSPATTASPATLSAAGQNLHRTTRKPATATTGASTAHKSNVFDRLSSKPTKSFENKVNRTARKGSSSSSIDVTGSPMRRPSPARKYGTPVDFSIQETLKSIFSTQTLNASRMQRDKKVAKKELPPSHLPRAVNRKVPSPRAPVASTISRIPVARSPIANSTSRRASSTPFVEKPAQQLLTQETKSKQHDRLTRFQLLPPVESEKDDLKKKLNKRLSEVVRTQQEQQRRRQEQQKRKSHLEEDFKRRTKLWSDSKDGTAPKMPLFHSSNALQQLDKNNTILHDLHTTDHRTIIGDPISGGSHDDYANQSLPYIHSDSENEEDLTLASWAKSPYLQRQLQLQQNWDPKKIFGPIPPLHIDQIFQNSRLSRLKPHQPAKKT